VLRLVVGQHGRSPAELDSSITCGQKGLYIPFTWKAIF
jgi:hypothetical protein